ncbi:MAG: hypothetical protein HKP30_05675 [Myxococcales bacterium]|nr:hypothetical protein [Myxococcales bacterium]
MSDSETGTHRDSHRSASDPDALEPEAPEGNFIPDKLAPLLRESTLWPVLVVLIAHFAAFGAWSLVLAVQEGRLSAMLGCFGLVWLTGTAGVAEIRQSGRPGPLCVVIGLTWSLMAFFFFAARHWQIV